MARKKKDQLSMIGLLSAILRNTAQQRSLAKGRDKRQIKLEKRAEKLRQKHRRSLEPKDKRTPVEIRAEIESTRGALVGTVAAIKTDLSLPTRLRLWSARLSKKVPRDLKGEPEAGAIAGTVLATGLGVVALSARAAAKRPKSETVEQPASPPQRSRRK